MNPKQQLQQDLREAMRMQDQPRVHVIRMIIAAFEQAQEAMGKQAFDSSNGADIQPDRHQALSDQAIQDILLAEVGRRQEAIDILQAGKQTKRAEEEEKEIAILKTYLTRIYPLLFPIHKI